MPTVASNGIELYYESRGSGPPLVMIMGIGAQLVNWPPGLVDEVVARGFRVILFDNRDTGLSTHLHGVRVPRLQRIIGRGMLGFPVEAPYSLLDMADDVAGLLDALDIADAHVLGVSLGGMVAQSLTIAHPSRVRTLTSVMSTTGNRWVSIPRPRALKALMGKAPRSEDEAVAHMVNFRRVCGSTAYPVDEAMYADIARQQFRRGLNPRGFLRQLAAIFATGDRTGALRFVRTPTLVFHGRVDPLVPVAGGRATARAIPRARLKVMDGMGHDLPAGIWPILADAVADHARAHDPSFTAGAGASASRASAPA